jgi:hypothetical protein
VWPLLLHNVAIDCQFVNEIDDHDKMGCLVKPKRLLNSMPRAGPRDLTNQALRYGTIARLVRFMIRYDVGFLSLSVDLHFCVGITYLKWRVLDRFDGAIVYDSAVKRRSSPGRGTGNHVG